MRKDPDRSIRLLLTYLLVADLDKIQAYLKGTEAESLVSDKIEKTAISIKSVLATYLKSLRYIKEDANPFSIRKWIQNDADNHWLFITSLGDRHESLKPLITSWLDIAINTLISLPEDSTRRVWLILDELASLNTLPYLTAGLAEARKFGGCFVIGVQSIAQLRHIYGQDKAKEISSLLNTRFLFRQPDPEISSWSSRNFGELIHEEVSENISYGANSMRDGVSMQRREVRKPVISYSEIMRLPNLSCYVRLPGNFPVCEVSFTYMNREKHHAGFLRREIEDQSFKELKDMIEDNEKLGARNVSNPVIEENTSVEKELYY